MAYLDEFDDLGLSIEEDAKFEEGPSYKDWEDKKYEVNGIAKWIKVDEEERPYFTMQGERKIAMANLRMPGSDEPGPPISMTRPEICCLVRAFGGNPDLLPPDDTPRFLMMAQEEANKAGRVREAKVYKGWCGVSGGRYVAGAYPDPNITYMWEYLGARPARKTDNASIIEFMDSYPRPGKNNTTYTKNIVYLQFRIVSDYGGDPTPYDGFVMEYELVNPFDVERSAQGPEPKLAITETGNYKAEAKRFVEFVRCFCNGMGKHSWQSDPEKSVYGINELKNPIFVYLTNALKSKKKALSKILVAKSGRPSIDVKDFSPARGAQAVDREAEQKRAMRDPKELLDLVETIERVAGFPVFKPTASEADTLNTELTDEGKGWARENLVDAWTKLDLPLTDGFRVIRSLDPAQMKQLGTYIANLKAPFATDDDIKQAAEVGF